MKIKVAIVLISQLVMLAIASTKPQDRNSLELLDEKLTMVMDELNQKNTISIYGDMVSLVKVTEDPRSSESSVDPLVSKIEEFLRTRQIQINLPTDGSTTDFLGRALGQKNIHIELKSLTQGKSEARTKLKKMILPLLLLLKLKALIILPIVISVIALVGIKGLSVGLMSLVLSGAVALKALFTPPPPPRVSYGVVRPHEIHHDHWHRSEQEINQPYKGWAPDYSNDQYSYHDIQ